MGGSHYERQLVNTLRTLGYAALRAPSSGSATKDNLPDILAGKSVLVSGFVTSNGRIQNGERASNCLAIELKTTSETIAYADASEIDALINFAKEFGANPYLGVKFKRKGGSRSPFYLVEPEFCRQTDGGNYGVPEDTAEGRAAWILYPETDNADAEIREGVNGR